MSIEFIDAPFVVARILGTMTEQREILAEWANMWLSYQQSRNAQGCLIFDIDETVITRNEGEIKPMCKLYRKYRNIFPCYFVTARPDTAQSKTDTIRMLKKLDLDGYAGIHFMPEKLYRSNHVDAVLDYKFGKRCDILQQQRAILARFGDMIWDVASVKKNKSVEELLDSRNAAIMFLPGLNGEVGVKLPSTN
tara:strand:+ start:17 stop:595 length:579 start_codon:yes stop_codon:yes gene_type:complete